jgi:hypothetical protein
MITTYHLSEIEDFEDFLNNLFIGLQHYKKSHREFTFKIAYTKDTITLKTHVLDNGQLN